MQRIKIDCHFVLNPNITKKRNFDPQHSTKLNVVTPAQGFDFHAKTKVFPTYDLTYKCNYNHFPVLTGEIQGIRIYCHFVLNPNITIKNGTLTQTTQQN